MDCGGCGSLDRLDLEAVYLYEKHPSEFRRLRELMSDTAAADVLLHWREYFGLKRADDTDRAVLVSELAALSPRERRLAARYPAALPLLLADPSGTSELIEAFQNDNASLGEVLSVLSLISLEHGAADLRRPCGRSRTTASWLWTPFASTASRASLWFASMLRFLTHWALRFLWSRA